LQILQSFCRLLDLSGYLEFLSMSSNNSTGQIPRRLQCLGAMLDLYHKYQPENISELKVG